MFKLSIEDEGINEFLDELTDMELKMKSPDFKREVLEAMAMPVVRSAKVNVARSFKTRSGKLQKGIMAEWRKSNPDEIIIGWTSDAFYGMIHERGYRQWKSRRFYKIPHMRPAFESSQEEAYRAGIEKAKKLLN